MAFELHNVRKHCALSNKQEQAKLLQNHYLRMSKLQKLITSGKQIIYLYIYKYL